MNLPRHSRGAWRFGPALSAAARSAASALLTAGVLTLPISSAGTPGLDSTATDLPPTTSLPPGDQTDVLPPVPEPFGTGESLKFSVQYGFINAGTAYLEVQGVTDWNGHPAYTLQARAQSNAFFSRFYKVRNRIESVWDRDGRFSYRYAEDRHEGGYKAKIEILFDHEHHEARYSDGRTFPIPPQVQDALSAFYYTRFQALPIGGSVIFDYHASRKSQPLEVRVLGRQRVQTPAGHFDCVMIEPILKAGGIFKAKGRLVIWLTDDQRRMPVMMRSKVMVGSISVILQQARRGT